MKIAEQICFSMLIFFLFKFQVIKALDNFDFIIVGAGTAGAVVASRLSENPDVSVLLIEAGGNPPIFAEIPAASSIYLKSPITWQYDLTSNDACLSYVNKRCPYYQGKVLGGASTIYQMRYERGNHRDFDNWQALGNSGWDYPSVLPFFLKSEGNTIEAYKSDTTYHNSSGPLVISDLCYRTDVLGAFLKSGEENGYEINDCNAETQTGFMQYALLMKKGAKWSSYDAYLRPASQRNNLVIYTNSLVTKIIFDESKKATAVVYKDAWFTERTVNVKKEVILSAGTLASPKILMLSGIGPEDQLEELDIPVVSNLAGVGQNLQDHVTCYAPIFSINCTDCNYDLYSAFSVSSIAEYFLFGKGPLTVSYLSEGLANMNSKYAHPNDDYPDVQIDLVSGNMAKSYREFQTYVGITYDVAKEYFGPLADKNAISLTPIVLRPKSRGFVKLQNKDPNNQPIVDFKTLSDPEDVEVMIEGIKLAVELANSPSLQKFGAKINSVSAPGCKNYTQFSDEYWECACRHLTWLTHDAVGTCKMGSATDLLAVVDEHLKVYGVSGLRVVDASIMPTIPSGGAAATTFMIAEKASQAIKDEYQI